MGTDGKLGNTGSSKVQGVKPEDQMVSAQVLMDLKNELLLSIRSWKGSFETVQYRQGKQELSGNVDRQVWVEYISAMVNLHGIVPVEQVAKVISEQNEEQVSAEAINDSVASLCQTQFLLYKNTA